MADRPQQIQVHHIQHPQQLTEVMKSRYPDIPEKGPSTSQVVAVITLVPVGGILLTLAGITLTITVIGLALTTPVFVIFSPVLVPATIVIGLAMMGFLASGVCGLTALSALSWMVNYLRGKSKDASADFPETLDYAKRRMLEGVGQVGQRTKDVGQAIQSKAQESARAQEGGRTQEGSRTQEGGRT